MAIQKRNRNRIFFFDQIFGGGDSQVLQWYTGRASRFKEFAGFS
jgi:hypothetical protein